MKLTVYGSGCAKCQQLSANAEAAARRLGLEFEVEKVTPALAVDEEIVVEGKVPSSDELEQLLG